jgi:hypothetical protein
MIGIKQIKGILLLLLVFNTSKTNAQFYNQGSDPASIKWRVVTTANFKIIYPEQIDSLAKRYAITLEKEREAVNGLHGLKSKKFPVILHPFDVFSNGLVVWAPKRAEFKTTPQPFSGYPQTWERQLSLHEQRHIFQMMNFENGLFKPLSWFIGEQAAGLGVGLYLSKWELEGDAVDAETKYSGSGRGRDPEFLLHYKAAFLTGDLRKLQHWSMGTLKKYEPNHYSFGYLFLSGIEEYYGQDVFEKALKYRLKNPLDLNGSNNSYKSITGLKTKKAVFREIQERAVDKWRREDSLNGPYSKVISLSKSKNNYENYESLSLLPYGRLISVRESLDNIFEIGYLDTSGCFTKLTNAGFINSGIQNIDNKIFWSEGVPSVRWEQESFSKIVCYDINTGVKRYFAGKTRLYNPYPIDSKTVMAVEYPVEGSSNLVFIDIESERILSKVKVPDGNQAKEAVCINGVIYFSMISESGMSLMSYTLSKRCFTKIKDFGDINISYLWPSGKRLYFRSDLENKNNLFCYNTENEQISMPVNVRFAAKAPIEDSLGNMIFLNYSAKGYSPVICSKNELNFNSVKFPEVSFSSSKFGFKSDSLTSEKYSKLGHSVNIHSWAPLYYDIDELQAASFSANDIPVKPGFMIMSQDLLNSTFAMAGYSYENGKNSGHLRLKYSGLAPVFELSADFNERDALKFYREEDSEHPGKYLIKTSSIEKSLIRGILQTYVPLNLSRGGRSRFLIPQFAFKYKNDSYQSQADAPKNSYYQFVAALQYYDLKNLAKRNIYPSNGFGFYARFSNILGTDKFFGPMHYLSGYVYFPGILPNHGLKISAIYQNQNVTGKYFYQENVSNFVRGYENFYAQEISALKFNYVLPVYITQNFLLEVLYVKRFQVIPFFDIAHYKRGSASGNIRSFGTDLLADFNIFGITFPFSGGVRLILRGDKKSDIEFLLNMSL